MYCNFFALSDLPFSISPDPKYVFMSDRHKEALSHLTYGLGDAGGFALLTGEVGTGKTTVSRCLMEQLPDNTQAAFILNPMLSSHELLATLCDKLAIEYQIDDISLKHLTDKISEKLLANHEQGLNTLLIIDEAQHLQPEVLEQLRLLTNLETNTKKLLQVILIGQPELQQLLQRRDLRQLAQRITARYHLMPLTRQELIQYIEHRLMIADCTRKLFDHGAIKTIHQLSEGVPRLTNLLCHSALMLAYNQNDSVVNKKTVLKAAETALGIDAIKHNSVNSFHNPLLTSTVVFGIAFITLAAFWFGQSQKGDVQTPLVHTSPIEQTAEAAQEVSPVVVQVAQGTATINPEPTAPKTALNEDLQLDEEALANMPRARYTVQYGDSLYTISIQFNVKISALRRWNNMLDTDTLSIGDKLHVSAPPRASGIENNVSVQSRVVKTNEIKISNELVEYKSEEMLVVSSDKPSSESNNEVDYTVEPIDGVSDDLLARFQAAIDETEELDTSEPEITSSNSNSAIKPIGDLPINLQNSLPSMQFEQHIYSSDGKGWVTVNGRDRYEGDFISNGLMVEKILPQQVVLSYQGERFSLPALTNW